MSTTSTKAIHPLLKELGLVSKDDTSTSAAVVANHQKKQYSKPTNISALDILQHLLETNVLSSDQLKATHASLKEIRSKKSNTKNNEHNEKATPPNQEAPPAAANNMNKPEYRTRHIALRVYYEGKQYNGLAQTVGMESDNSVERQVFAALQKTHLIQSRDTCGYSRCGRTDKGVSAVGQVIAMRLKSAIPLQASWDQEGQNLVPNTPQGEEQLPKNANDTIVVWVPPRAKNINNKSKKAKKKAKLNPPAPENSQDATNPAAPRNHKEVTEYAYDKMLNSVLPDDIRILGWCPVSEEFSARFSASTRTYRYFFVRRTLDLDAMRQGLQRLVGTHDFRNFCKLNVVEVSNFVRKIHAADLISYGGEEDSGSGNVYYFQIQGQAFLWHQIRCIVEILFMIGRRLEPPSVVAELLNVNKYPGKPSYAPAAEFPLVLHDCGYPNLQMGYSVPNLWTVTCQMEEQWEKIVLEAARVRNCLEMLRRDVHVVRKDDLEVFAKQRLLERTKKQRRNTALSNKQEPWTSYIEQIEKEEKEERESGQDKDTNFMSWAEGIEWLQRWKLIPDPNGLRDHVHIPLLERSKGTTYEEKIQAIQEGSTKRSQRFEENAAKKRKSEGTDSAFYDHMLSQGGSAH